MNQEVAAGLFGPKSCVASIVKESEVDVSAKNTDNLMAKSAGNLNFFEVDNEHSENLNG